MKIFFVLLFFTLPLNALDPQIEDQATRLIKKMTLDEKIDYIGGHNYFYIRAVDRLKIPELTLSDGPLGAKGVGRSTAYPATILLASSWDEELAMRYGRVLGQDARARGVHVLLAPGMNICRLPLCGRNFEYLGEDPYLSARMASSIVKGIQSQKVIATAKHFACNNQEWNRHNVSADLDERTLREMYLPAFEACVKEANVGAIMASYNLVNGTHATQNKELLDIAKREWGFDGFVVSDWNAVYSGVEAAKNGLDLEMPYAKGMSRDVMRAALKDGTITEEIINDKVRRILRKAIEFGFLEREQQDQHISLFNQEGQKVALEIAQGGIVLLKNKGVLPLDVEKLQSIAIIGPRAVDLPFGGGSSEVEALCPKSVLGEVAEMCGDKTKVFYCRGSKDLRGAFDWNRFTQDREGKVAGFVGEYFTNLDFKGEPFLRRTDERIDFTWRERSFCKDGPCNNYSVRWTGYFTPSAWCEHTLYVSGEDSFKLYVDGVLQLSHTKSKGESCGHKTLFLEGQRPYKIFLEYSVGYGPQGVTFGVTTGKDTYLEQAKKIASLVDAVVLCVGFTHTEEGESYDRSFKLPEAQNELIRTVLATNPNTIIVLTSGGNVDMSAWIDKTPALLYAGYPGEVGAKALAQILFGKISPSGKLCTTFERRLEDNACFENYHDKNDTKRTPYSEGLFVGYRHFDKTKIKPLFPFGHGLSYTTFAYSDLALESTPEGMVNVSFTITNTGNFDGAEVAQVYVCEDRAKVVRPLKELKSFKKVFLKPQETKRVKLQLPERSFSYYDSAKKEWHCEKGSFTILVGSSAETIELQKQVNLSR